MSEPQSAEEIYRALQRRARREGRGTQELFEFYLLERFLFRLSLSRYRDRFVLKGGLLLTVLGVRRPTRDADVLARGVAGDEESLLAVVRELASIPAEDGMTFDASRARAMTIREHAAYPGTRIVVPATLGTARLQLRLDDKRSGEPVDLRRDRHRRQLRRGCGLVRPLLTALRPRQAQTQANQHPAG